MRACAVVFALLGHYWSAEEAGKCTMLCGGDGTGWTVGEGEGMRRCGHCLDWG